MRTCLDCDTSLEGECHNRTLCKSCAKERRRESLRKHRQKPEVKEQMRERAREYMREHRQKPEAKEQRREYRQKPEVKEYMRKYQRKYQRKYRQKPEVKERSQKPEVKERKREYMREYFQKPEVKERKREYMHKRRAKAAKLVHDLTAYEWEETLVGTEHKCVYCGAPWEHQDHFVPLSKGGGYTALNMVPSCASCNFSKNNKDPFEFIRELPYVKKTIKERRT